MAQYEADKIIRLLQFCCWKTKCEMNHSGFKDLLKKLDDSIEPGQFIPNERYLVDLLSDANIAVKTDNLIGRKAEYINLLLKCAGFDSKNHFSEHLYRANEYISASGVDLSSFSSIETAICFSSPIEKHILSNLSFVCKTTAYPLNLLCHPADNAKESLEHVISLLNEYPFLIWVIPAGWKDKLPVLADPSWETLVLTKRILPIWLDESNLWEVDQLHIPWLKKTQTISGLSDVLLGVQFIQEVIQKYHDPNAAYKKKEDFDTGKRVQNLRDNQGAFFLGDIQIHGGNISMRDIHQTINKTKDHE